MRACSQYIALALAILSVDLRSSYGQADDQNATEIAKLIQSIQEGDLATRWRAAYRLGQLGPSAEPATDALIASLRDKDFRVVWYSIFALGNMGDEATRAVPALREALTAEKDAADATYVSPNTLGDKYTRRFAATALGRIGSPAESAAGDLRRAMASSDASLRVAAALALWNVAADTTAIDVLGKMLAADDVNAAHEAALAFTQLGSAGRPGIAALVRALNSNTDDVRRSAARALGQLGPVAMAALVDALASDNVGVRRAAALGFGWLGKTVSDKVLENDKIALATFHKIYGQLDATAVAALRVALADDDADVRRLAAEAIGSIGPVAIPTLVSALQEPNQDLRSSAALAMERIESRSQLATARPEFAEGFRKASVGSLLAALQSDDPFVRLQAVRMFSTLGVASVAPNARPQLVRLLKDDNVQVRRYASSALRQIRQSKAMQPTAITPEKKP